MNHFILYGNDKYEFISKALHIAPFELTGKADSFILSIDLEPVLTAQKQHEATAVLSL